MVGSPRDTTVIDLPAEFAASVSQPRAGLARLSLNQRTTAGWDLRSAIDGCVKAGVPAIGVWREPVSEVGLATAVSWLLDAGLRVSSVCRGGFFTAADAAARRAAHDENLRALDEAAALAAPTLILVPGGLPAGDRDIAGARERAAAAIGSLADEAQSRGVRLGIEPMHPMFAADRGVISTLAQAIDVAEQFPADQVGVVVDTFHLWWEPDILEQIARAGARITAYQIGDWITPLPSDALLSRGMIGDGHIDFAVLTSAVTAAGYRGDVEVEIFNKDIWSAPGDEVVATMVNRYVDLVAPFLTSPG
jgi:sugar phosphate isomerase/epimerase